MTDIKASLEWIVNPFLDHKVVREGNILLDDGSIRLNWIPCGILWKIDTNETFCQ